MINIYCHIHTPVNIEDENVFFIPPINFEGNLYIIKEKSLRNILIQIGYFQEYIRVIRENGYNDVSKWLYKKNLLNENFLEAISQYWIEDIYIKHINDYKYCKKNNINKPIIADNYLKNIFKSMVLYNYIKQNNEKFNDNIYKILNVLENELAFIKEKKSLKIRLVHYQNKIFDIIIDSFLSTSSIELIKEKEEEINNVSFVCETLLSRDDLFVYKTGCIDGYKDFNFKVTNYSHNECLRENTFVKLYSTLNKSYYSEHLLKNIFNELSDYSQIFTSDKVDFGVEHLKRIIKNETTSAKKAQENVKSNKEFNSSKVALLQKTQTIISETEDHIISRYSSLKNHTNFYFAQAKELKTLLAVLNMDKTNLKRINNLLWDKQNKIETDLIRFTFKQGNLPYSAYGFASLNF